MPDFSLRHQIDTIGLIYSCTSIAYVTLVPFVLPWMQKRLGTKNALLIILSGWSALALLMPLVQWSAVHTRGFMWALIVLQQMLKCFASFGLPCAPSTTVRGAADLIRQDLRYAHNGSFRRLPASVSQGDGSRFHRRCKSPLAIAVIC